MLEKFVHHLVSPNSTSNSALELAIEDRNADHIISGTLSTSNGESIFRIVNGVPSFLTNQAATAVKTFEGAASQRKTTESFSDKWRRFRSYGLRDKEQEFLFRWYCEKFGLKNEIELQEFYGQFELVLEVGPGSGFNTRYIAQNSNADVFALDISDAAHTTFENTRHLPNCCVVQADLMNAPFDDDKFDFVIADGVLHHTPNTKRAVEALYHKVRPGGRFFFYVYKQMGAARRFADSYIREHYTKLSAEECYKACEAITELGRELTNANVEITLEKPIDVLGIPAGTHKLQRLIYYNFLKCFWNDAFDYETNNMVNFDWYHPHDAWQHTKSEVVAWLREFGVSEYKFNDANPNGISVILRKPS